VKLQTRNPAWVHAGGALVVLVLSSVLILSVIQPMWRQRADRSKVAGELTQQVSARDGLERERRALSTRLANVNESAERATIQLMGSGELNQQLASITDLAAASGVQVEALEPMNAVANAKFRLLPIRLSGRASYLATTRFFESLRQQLPDTSIRAFQMRSDNSGSSPVAIISMELLWCTKPDAPAQVSSTK
jgi:Tfp pilus assembly protein PilO